MDEIIGIRGNERTGEKKTENETPYYRYNYTLVKQNCLMSFKFIRIRSGSVFAYSDGAPPCRGRLWSPAHSLSYLSLPVATNPPIAAPLYVAPIR